MFNLTPTTLARVEPLITVSEAHCLVADGKRSRHTIITWTDSGEFKIDAPESARDKSLEEAQRSLHIFEKMIDSLKEGELSAYIATSGAFIGRIPPEYWCTIGESTSSKAFYLDGKPIHLSQGEVEAWSINAKRAVAGAQTTDRELHDRELAAWAKARKEEGLPMRDVSSAVIKDTWQGFTTKAPPVKEAQYAVKLAWGDRGPGRPKAND